MSEPRRLHPATLFSRTLQVLPQVLLGAVAAGAGTGGMGAARMLAIAGAAALIGAAFTFVAWWRFRYTVGDGEIVIEKGLLHRQRRVIPFDRVHDIAIERRLLARLFGTAKVKIETGGSAADEGKLDMIGLADAHALRDRVRRGRAEAAEASETAGAAEAPPAAEPVLFEMKLGRLLHSGLFNFSLLFLALIFAVLQNLVEFGLLDIKEWVTAERADRAAGLVNLRVAAVVAVLVLLLGMVSGVARTVARDFGFRLTRSEAGLRRRRGLFTLTEVVIPIRRTQVALIESGPVARLFGWYRLSFQTLGADPKEGGVQVAIPFGRMAEIEPVLAEAGFPAPPPRPEFVPSPRRALLRSALPWLLLAALAGAAAFLVEPRAGIVAAALVGLGLVAALRWRKRGHALDDRALFISAGLLRRRRWIVPFEKIQTISLARGPVQRRLRLATVQVDTAGGSVLRPTDVVDLDCRAGEALADRLLSLFYEARARTAARR